MIFRHGQSAKLGLSESYVRRLVMLRRIPYIKLGRAVRFDLDDIERWVRERRVA
ncbi:MAG: helix-turn-helix transcriptional regulator [Alkalispirochaeta sp.]